MFGASLALLVTAELGLDPWEVFHRGISTTFDVRLGAVVVGTSIAVLVVWFPLHQRPGIGTVLNAVLVGVVFEITISVLGDVDALLARWLVLASAIVLNAVGTGMYIGAGLGPGPRDGLMTGIAGPGRSIRQVRTGIETGALGLGWLLGGTVGIGTVVYALSIGPLVHLSLPLFTITDPSTNPTQPSVTEEAR
ncbi:membrane protein [soil metagenome]